MTHLESGTLIRGTSRPQDLIPRFLAVLLEVDSELYYPRFMSVGLVGAMLDGDDAVWWRSDEAADMVAELQDELDVHAPAGHVFGPHEGDASDLGFWPVDD